MEKAAVLHTVRKTGLNRPAGRLLSRVRCGCHSLLIDTGQWEGLWEMLSSWLPGCAIRLRQG